MNFFGQKELYKIFLFSHERIEKEKEEINKINVFPVPDQDTGSNVAKTLLGIKEAISGKEFKSLKELSDAALDGALISAQGNAGIIYTGFLADFLTGLGNNSVDARVLSVAFEKGAKRARASILNPKAGTILDVIDAASFSIKKEIAREKNIIKILKKALEKANDALLATREKMAVLKKANVVDAGGLAFLMILESYLEALEGSSPGKKTEDKPSEKIRRFIQFLSNRYEVICLIKISKINEAVLKHRVKNLGDSLDIVRVGDKIKLHIHTDYPDEVKNILKKSGQIIDLKTTDMADEAGSDVFTRKVGVGIVIEDVAGLPQKILERYQVETVRSPSFYPSVFKNQLKKFGKILCLTASSDISENYQKACSARLASKTPEKIFVLDSRTAVAGQALLTLKAIELVYEQKEIGEIISELGKMTPKINLSVAFHNPSRIKPNTVIKKSEMDWLKTRQKINIHPSLSLKDGLVKRGRIILAMGVAEALFKDISRGSRGKKIRVVISHADNLEEAKKLKNFLRQIKAEVCYINSVPQSVENYTGKGALGVAWLPLDQ